FKRQLLQKEKKKTLAHKSLGLNVQEVKQTSENVLQAGAGENLGPRDPSPGRTGGTDGAWWDGAQRGEGRSSWPGTSFRSGRGCGARRDTGSRQGRGPGREGPAAGFALWVSEGILGSTALRWLETSWDGMTSTSVTPLKERYLLGGKPHKEKALPAGQLAAGTCEIVTLDRDSSQPRRTIARQTARCACRKGQIAGTTRARPACVDARIIRTKQWCDMLPCLESEGCDLLINRSGWTCTQPGGRIKTTTVS
uniref:TAFA chemokine like family member 5 n=1 Tax=Suricata suricatta TaxID=37032 RepID=A0A673V9X4_SURSU